MVQRLPVLLVVTHRPEFQHRWGGEPHVTLLELERLGERESATLVQNLAVHATLEPTLVAEIVERTDGVPLFVEELTKAVLESADRVAALLAASPGAQLAIPAALHASLTARLDRLGPAAKEVAQVGAVLGREFTYELLNQVANRRDLDVTLRRLADAGLLSCRGLPPRSSYLFKHALVQDVAYATLLRTRRQELHGRVALALSQNFSDMVEHQPELLAHHLTAAGDNERAIALCERLDSAPEHLNVLYWLAVAHGLRGELSQAAEATEAGVALAEARGDRPALINSLRGAALAHLLTGHLAKALDRCQRAVAIFDASDEVEQRGSALRIEWR